jgi:hypothetical protein
MSLQTHAILAEVESLVRTKLANNGNAHLADAGRWVARVEAFDSGYSITARIFCKDARPLVGLFGDDSGFEPLGTDEYHMSDIPNEEIALSLIILILEYSFAYTPTTVHDLELSSLRHSGDCLPWEVLSSLYFGDPRTEETTETSDKEGGEN